MTQHPLSHQAMTLSVRGRWPDARAIRQLVIDRSFLLPLGAAIALVWANTASESYFRFAHGLAFPVNEIGMSLFLGLVAQEAFEAMMPGGVLHTWRRWGMAIAAAAGGLLGTVFVYLAYVYLSHEQVLAQAWPIACAIDIAAGYYLLKIVAPRSSMIPFLLVLAMAVDAVGLAVLALWTPFGERHLAGAVGLILAVGLAAIMRRRKVTAFWPYLAICGTASWLAFFWAGVHPALALVPIVPFLPHRARRLDVFADPPDDGPVHHAEHEWTEVVQVVLFLFGLVNAGVLLTGHDTGTWAILTAALVGRPLGILAAVGLALSAGLHLPRRLGWRELIVVACATSSGFTFALFFASGVLPVGAVLQQIKLGALATAAGALLVVAAARLLRVGRFAR
jgi:NhaA family Na+:H+ antiporter